MLLAGVYRSKKVCLSFGMIAGIHKNNLQDANYCMIIRTMYGQYLKNNGFLEGFDRILILSIIEFTLMKCR